MPELPEVETIRRTLLDRLVGRRVGRVVVRRPGIVRGPRRGPDLLAGSEIVRLRRHGKQLALIGRHTDGREHVVVIQLGMTGQLLFLANGVRLARRRHVHLVWTIFGAASAARDGNPGRLLSIEGRLVFRDPRRFGRVSALGSSQALRAWWARLGPDALDVKGANDRRLARLWKSRSPIKTALMNQALIAGVGNIYADEALFAAGIHPGRTCRSLRPSVREALVRSLRIVMARALRQGGSSIQAYVDGDGRPGRFARSHAVYGRGGQACIRCAAVLRSSRLGQRTTVWCPLCQSR